MISSNVISANDKKLSYDELKSKLETHRGCDLFLVSKKPEPEDCEPDTVYVYLDGTTAQLKYAMLENKKEEPVKLGEISVPQKVANEVDTDNSSAPLVTKTKDSNHKKPPELIKKLVEGSLDNLDSQVKGPIIEKLPSIIRGSKRLNNPKHLEAIFKITQADETQPTANEFGVLRLFQTAPENVANGLISAYGVLLVSKKPDPKNPENKPKINPNTVYVYKEKEDDQSVLKYSIFSVKQPSEDGATATEPEDIGTLEETATGTFDNLEPETKKAIKSNIPGKGAAAKALNFLRGKNYYRVTEPEHRQAIFDKLTIDFIQLCQEKNTVVKKDESSKTVEKIAAEKKTVIAIAEFEKEQKLTKERQDRFLEMLEEVQIVYDTLLEGDINPSCYFFSNYTKMLAKLYVEHEKDELDEAGKKKILDEKEVQKFFNALFDREIKKLNKWAKRGEHAAMATYGLFSTAALVSSILAMTSMDISSLFSKLDNPDEDAVVWGEADSAAGLPMLLKLFKEGEMASGLAVSATSVGVLASSVLLSLSEDFYTASPLIALPVAAASSILGFAFFVSTIVPVIIEQYAVEQCEGRIEVIDEKIKVLKKEKQKYSDLTKEEVSLFSKNIPSTEKDIRARLNEITEEKKSLDEDIESSQSSLSILNSEEVALKKALIPKIEKKINALEKAKVIEEVSRDQHKRNRNAWISCSTAVGIGAVVCLLALSGLSFGVLPAAMVVTMAVGFLTVFARGYWIHYHNQQSLEKTKSRTAAFFKPENVDGDKKVIEMKHKKDDITGNDGEKLPLLTETQLLSDIHH